MIERADEVISKAKENVDKIGKKQGTQKRKNEGKVERERRKDNYLHLKVQKEFKIRIRSNNLLLHIISGLRLPEIFGKLYYNMLLHRMGLFMIVLRIYLAMVAFSFILNVSKFAFYSFLMWE